jgi:uncharacterized protein YprB with RNaseH-like and TPR domain
MFTPELRRRLSEIARGRPASKTHLDPIEAASTADYAALVEFSPEERENEHGGFVVFECRMSDVLSDTPKIVCGVSSFEEISGARPSELLFLDLETCGLAGVPVFLVGTMRLVGSDFEIRQFFARDYSQEKSMLAGVGELVAGVEGYVTFNGKCFDIPFLVDRAARHKLDFTHPRVHLDMLGLARRKWRRVLPDCRLQTLETRVCGRSRSGDIPGSEIPALYHESVKAGDIGPLLPVLKHNVLDLMTMAELLPQVI